MGIMRVMEMMAVREIMEIMKLLYVMEMMKVQIVMEKREMTSMEYLLEAFTQTFWDFFQTGLQIQAQVISL